MKGQSENKLSVAVKIVDTRVQSEYVRRFLPREMALVKNLNHDCVLRVFQTLTFVLRKKKLAQIVYCFCLRSLKLVTSLYSSQNFAMVVIYFRKSKKQKEVPESDARLIFRQLIEALIYLQRCDIVHRDLKCENVFLDLYDNVKLGDFGFARYLKPNEKANTFCGSRAYVAPEILRAIAYTGQTVDIWSAGVVLYVMVTGVMPYDDRNPQKMVERQLGHRLRFPKMELSVQVKTLIYEILHPYPPSRPTYKAICSSDWLKNTPYMLKGVLYLLYISNNNKNNFKHLALFTVIPVTKLQAVVQGSKSYKFAKSTIKQQHHLAFRYSAILSYIVRCLSIELQGFNFSVR
ncbi:kinase domain protein [Dictyocaulus viviparus]|uniref:Kinase domain protein n=1 Tax=Dictyocaulus viviparus TaxID=29172 RepID=A0A0D8Y7V2_DICVI|nr:kinase domain protein [Dictyocaulus viviparus]